MESSFSSLLKLWRASIQRIVPERPRIAMDWVCAPPLKYRTPFNKSPLLTPGGGKKHIIAVNHILGLIDLFYIFSPIDGSLFFFFIAGPGFALYSAADTAYRRGGKHALRRAPDTHQYIDIRLRQRGFDSGGNIAIGNQLYPGAGVS